jgi:hypothetical protein
LGELTPDPYLVLALFEEKAFFRLRLLFVKFNESSATFSEDPLSPLNPIVFFVP